MDERQRDRIMKHRTAAMEGRFCCILWALAIFLLAVLAPSGQSQGREIPDMFGEKVNVPDRPRKVYSTSPPVTYMLYALDPTMLAGLNFPVREWESGIKGSISSPASLSTGSTARHPSCVCWEPDGSPELCTPTNTE